MTMANIESLKTSILSEFKERGKKVGEAIYLSEWYEKILPNYTAEEQDLFMKVINELKKEGKIECRLREGISLR